MKIQFLENLINKLPLNRNVDKAPAFKEAHSSSVAKYNISPQFVISGICILASIAIYFIFLSPLKSKNIELKSDLDYKAEKLERFSRKGKNIYSEKLIKVKDEEIALIEDELNICKEIISERDMIIERVFTDVDGSQITDEALWKDHYTRMCNDLVGHCNNYGLDVDIGNLELKEWDNDLPERDEVIVQQKRFWIQDEIMNIIVKNRSFIRNFHYIEFSDLPIPENKSLSSNLFTPIPFKLKLEMEQSKILYLISDILNSQLNFFIEVVNLENDEDYQPGQLSDPIYTVRIHAYAMDFNNET